MTEIKEFRNPRHRVSKVISHNEYGYVLILRDYTDKPNECIYLKSNDV